jgi:hypothetical protein
MPSPKKGKAGAAVPPAEPRQAEEADQANPGAVEKLKVEQRAARAGKYHAQSMKPHRPPQTEEGKATKDSWIEIELVDEKDKPVPGERYRIILPDETVAEGTLDENGFARVEGIEPGTCKILLPDLEKDVWKRA